MNYPLNTYQPYSYRVIHKTSNKFYYGIQYGEDANPGNLWTSYFTSSVIIQSLIYVFGKDDFEVEIRQLFSSEVKARLWENKVLRKIDNWKNCLNKPSVSTNYYNKDKLNNSVKGKIRITNGSINKTVDSNYILENDWVRGTTISKEGKKNLGRKSGTKVVTNGKEDKVIKKSENVPFGFYIGTCKNKPNLGKIYVNNGIETKVVNKNEIPEGYIKGMIKIGRKPKQID